MLGEIKNSHHPHRKKFQTPRPSGELRVTGRKPANHDRRAEQS